MYKLEIGHNIKKYRESLGMTQQELADKLHTTRQCISSWEKDRTQPDESQLQNLAKVFGCSTTEIKVDYAISTGEHSMNLIIEAMQTLDSEALKRIINYANMLQFKNELGISDEQIQNAINNINK